MTSFQRNSSSRCGCYTSVRGPHSQPSFGGYVHRVQLLSWACGLLPPSPVLTTSSVVLPVRHSRRARQLLLARSSSLQCCHSLSLSLSSSSLKLSPFAALGGSAPVSSPLSLLLLNPLLGGSSSAVSFCFDRIRQPGARASTAGSGRRRWAGARVFSSRWPRFRAPPRRAVCSGVRCDAGQ